MLHRFTGGLSGLRQNEASYINRDSSPLSVFMHFFLEIVQLPVEERKKMLPPILGNALRRLLPTP
jgi:hypothetical protein